MAGGDHDTPFVGHHLALRMAVERACAGVHGGCQHISFQTEDEFTYPVVCLRAYVTKILLVCLLGPCLESPILIIQKYAPVFDCRRLTYVVLLKVFHFICVLAYRYIGKPVPGIDTYLLAYVEHAVRKASRIGSGYEDIVTFSVYGILLPLAAQLLVAVRVPCRCQNHVQSLAFLCIDFRFYARHPLYILRKHAGHMSGQSRILRVINYRSLGQIYCVDG